MGLFLGILGKYCSKPSSGTRMALFAITSDSAQACGFRTSSTVKSSPACILRFNSSVVIFGPSAMDFSLCRTLGRCRKRVSGCATPGSEIKLLTCAGLQFRELSHRSSGVYCAQEFNFFSLGIGNHELKNGGRG